MRAVLDRHGCDAQIWITEAGYSTWRHDEARQAAAYVQLREAPVERFYWYALQDLAEDVAVQEGPRFDQRHYHLGLYDAKGRPKLLARLLAQGGTDAVETVLAQAHPAPTLCRTHPVLVTGGAGFIGANLAHRLAHEGEHVLILDNLARPGVERNLAWLRTHHPRRLSVALADLRDREALAGATTDATSVFHLAAQTAVTTSLDDPMEDFAVNLGATVSLLEALRARRVPLVFASTNKVYGDLADVALARSGEAWLPTDADIRRHGIGEDRPISLHTPYGCSKGAADQYVLDYARSFDVPTAVLRMSCIYGPRQFGTEDQGWVAHFLIRALEGRPIAIFGDGRQVRDVLYVDDAVSAYLAVRREIGQLRGQAFNLGGGADNAVSLMQVLREIERLTGRPVAIEYGVWRRGDQRWYVSDTRRLYRAVGLSPPVDWRIGLQRLATWLRRDEGADEAAPLAEAV
ncbi:MAG: NAD-dependent epimerase/dehydratase family protein [Geminicoccaceae bacterium]|nr:NAD-dependent epimerase/dehydratase family protein [Geminicoccaceae bacterium]